MKASSTMTIVMVFGALTALTLLGSSMTGGGFVVTDDFVDYIKAATNPDHFGLREDGRFYPYSSPDGRRIAYRQMVESKDLYRNGWSKEEADQRLRRELKMVSEQLAESLPRRFGIRFEDLSPESQAILVDFAHSEGHENLSEILVRASTELNWKVLLDPAVYSRNEADWPDIYRNRAFIEKWGERGGIR